MLAAPVLVEVRRIPEGARCASPGRTATPPLSLGLPAGLVSLRGVPGTRGGEDDLSPAARPGRGADDRPVGNYGISIAWSDGHSTGIYRFEVLREICPCRLCRQGGEPRPDTRGVV
jgi:hypothetical protein